MRKQAGDDDFRAFYERLGPRAVSAASRLVNDGPTAEDIAGEAFARAYSHWNKVRRHPNPDAWLLRVVGNVAIDQIRRESRRPELERRSGGNAPIDHDAALRIDLTDAISRLSGRQQEVVVMRYLVDLSEEEVAAGLGLSTGAVKTHLHRATRKLRIDLDDLEADAVRPGVAP